MQLDFAVCSSLASTNELCKNFATLQAMTSVQLYFMGCSRLTSIDEFGENFEKSPALTSVQLRCGVLQQVVTAAKVLHIFRP